MKTLSQKQINNIVDKWIGTPYRHNCCAPNIGVDCVQLVVSIQKELGFEIHLPNYPKDWRISQPNLMDTEFKARTERMQWMDRSNIQFGDIVVMFDEHNWIKHLGIVLNMGYFIHILDDSLGSVRVDGIKSWKPSICGFVRMIR